MSHLQSPQGLDSLKEHLHCEKKTFTTNVLALSILLYAMVHIVRVSYLPTPMEGAIAGDMKNMVATAPTEATAAIAPGGKGDIVVVGAWFATVSAAIVSVKIWK